MTIVAEFYWRPKYKEGAKATINSTPNSLLLDTHGNDQITDLNSDLWGLRCGQRSRELAGLAMIGEGIIPSFLLFLCKCGGPFPDGE